VLFCFVCVLVCVCVCVLSYRGSQSVSSNVVFVLVLVCVCVLSFLESTKPMYVGCMYGNFSMEIIK